MRPPPFLSDDEINDPYTEVVADPLSTDFQRLWNNTARKNTEVYVDVFKVVPNDTIKTWDAYKVRNFADYVLRLRV
jgi:phospholipase D1/2